MRILLCLLCALGMSSLALAEELPRAANATVTELLTSGAEYIRIAFGARVGDPLYDAKYDLDRSGTIDGADLSLYLGKSMIKDGRAWSKKAPCYPKDSPYLTDEILVKFRAGTKPMDQKQRIESIGGIIKQTGERSGVLRITVPKGIAIDQALSSFASLPEVEYVEPNNYQYPQWRPNDQFYDYQWHLPLINMEEAWDISLGNASVKVAVLDTGIAYQNGSKAENLKCCTSTTYSGTVEYCAADDFAQTAFWGPWDYFYNDPYAWDDHGHGTHVTGTIAQSTNNRKGTAGIAPASTIIPVKISDSCGCSNDWVMAEAIYYAVDAGAGVINISFGGPQASQTLHDACVYAKNADVWIVAAAGNDASSSNYYGHVTFPAGYPEVIAVGAVNYLKQKSDYSNYGESSYGHGVDFAAPGGDNNDYNNDEYVDGVLQESFPSPDANANTLYLYTCRHFEYYFYTGTSMATPHVTGAIALLLAEGVTNREDIYEVLKATAEDLGDKGKDDYYGYGLINVAKALKYAKYGWGLNN